MSTEAADASRLRRVYDEVIVDGGDDAATDGGGSGVYKVVLREGSGEKPAEGSTCFVHYKLYLRTPPPAEPPPEDEGGPEKEDGSCVMDTAENGAPAEIRLGQTPMPGLAGVHEAVASMRAGEKSRALIGWKQAYGEAGCFSFPHVPPKCTIVADLQLLGFDASHVRERRSMLFEERLEAAGKKKEEGNELYREGEITRAISLYEIALAYLSDDLICQLAGRHLDDANAIRLPCRLNIAACKISEKEYDAAIEQCTLVLSEDPNNLRALLRRARARRFALNTDGARADLEKALKLSPDDQEAKREMDILKKEDKESERLQKAMFAGMFGRQTGSDSVQRRRGGESGGASSSQASVNTKAKDAGAQDGEQPKAMPWWELAWVWITSILFFLPSLLRRRQAEEARSR